MTAGRRIRFAGPWAALALVLVLALLPAGCGRCQRPSGEGVPGPGGEPGVAEQVGERPPLPEPGSAVVEVSERGVTVLANAARLPDVLRLLGKEAGFRLILGRLRRGDPLTLWIAELPLEVVLSQVLEGQPYENRYRADPEKGGHDLVAVAVGELESQQRRGSFRERLAKRKKRRDQRLEKREHQSELSSEERERLEEQRAAARREAEARLVREMEHADAGVRAEAARRVAPEGEGEELLKELLERDPSPQVRATAAQRLGGGDSYAIVGALLQSLNDPNPEVVISALDSLAFVGDASIAQQIMPLLSHPNPEVRDTAGETLEDIQ